MAEGGGDEKASASTPPVFISYASQDTAVANDIVEALERNGVRCWIAPRDVTPGASYAGQIIHAIDAAKASVLILSQDAASSPHVLREVERSASKRHPIVSLRIDQAPLPADFEYFLNTSHWLDTSAGDMGRALPKLVAAVQLALNAPVAMPADAPTSHTPASAVSGRSANRTSLVVASVVGLGLVGLAADRLWFSNHQAAATPAPAPTASAPGPVTAAPTIPEKSVAVLPFLDMSEHKDQEYFSDGLSEELIDMLTKVPELRVPARTSSFYFKGKPTPIAQIAQSLGVANVLEGSVRKSGSTFRITAQLIRADTGYHLWSVTYDRPIRDIFKTQEAIAEAIASALKVTVTVKTDYGGFATTSPEAFSLFLEASDQTARSWSDEETKGRLTKLQRAVALDPNYSDAWARIAILSINAAYGLGTDHNALAAQAHHAADHAIESGPSNARAFKAAAAVHSELDLDPRAAIPAYRRAFELDSNGITGLESATLMYTLQGDMEQAIAAAQKELKINPFGETSWFNLALVYYYGDRPADAEAAINRDLELSPADEISMSLAAHILLDGSKPEAALDIAQKIQKSTRERMALLPFIYDSLNRASDAESALHALIEHFGADDEADVVAAFYAHRGNADSAFSWLERAYARRVSGLLNFIRDPLFRNIRSDPRFSVFMRKLGLID